METFISPGKLIENPGYNQQRKETVSRIRFQEIDPPIRDKIREINSLAHVFTLQCCWGHFLSIDKEEPVELDKPSRPDKIEKLIYKIAYIAICVQNCREGIRFLQHIEKIALLDPGFIQFGSAQWFWQQQENSFVLQVTPERYKLEDRAILDYDESRRIQKLKKTMFNHLI